MSTMVISSILDSMYEPFMVRRFTILIFFIVFLTDFCYPQDTDKPDKLRDLVRRFGQAEVVIPYPGYENIGHLSRNVSIRSVKDKSVSIIISPLTLEWFIAAGYDYSFAERKADIGVISSENMQKAMYWDSYPTYTQYDSIMRFYAAEYPSLCRLDTIGESIKGKAVLVLKISDNTTADEGEPEVFFTSSIHGDETGGFVLLLRLSEYLLKNYNLENRIKDLVDNLEIWINPLANPDGTFNNGNEIYLPVRGNDNGYDLNRNFPDPLAPVTTRQIETIDMMRFLARRRFVLSANFHSGAEVVNYPWDRWSGDHADKDWFYNIARAYADTVHVYSVGGYMDYLDNGVTNGYQWYPVYGGRQDYVTYELQGRELTIEIDDDYVTPAFDLPDLWKYNKESLLGYLGNALYGIQGQVIDSETGHPVPAGIFISGHDKDNSHIYSDTLTGRFIRLIEPGIWDLTFTATGYRETIVRDVSVMSLQKTSLKVEMVSTVNPVDTAEKDEPVLYPNPGSYMIKAVLPRKINGAVNIKIFNSAGLIVADYDTEAVDEIPVRLDISHLAAGTYSVLFSGRQSAISYRSRFVVIR